MALRDVSLPALAIAGAGAIVVYGATKGVGAASGFRALLGGQPFPAGVDLSATDTAGDTAGDGGQVVEQGVAPASNNAIAAAALAYKDRAVYRWGGGNPTRGWDCSGFVNWVLCHDLRLAIPGYAGGTFTGSVHGPVTGQWALWSGCTNIPRDQVTAGDLIVWPTQHMGIAVDNNQMINCPGPNGSVAPVLSSIDHHPDLFGRIHRRLNGVH